MRLSIRYRLFLSLLLATATTGMVLLFSMQWSLDRGFLHYVNTLEQERLEQLAADLESLWSREGSWRSLEANPPAWLRLLAATLPEGHPGSRRLLRLSRRMEHSDHPREFPPRLADEFAHLFEARAALVAPQGRLVAGARIPEGGALHRELRAGERLVGTLLLPPQKELEDIHQLSFLSGQKQALGLAALALVLVSGLVALPLSRRLTRRVRDLAAGTRQLAAGRFEHRVKEEGGDELGQLARDFNELAAVLEKNEGARRRFIADISHELRTPLSVLRGEIEALQDGVRPTDTEAISSLHGEVLRLGRLVEDLYQLALSDLGALSYRKERMDLGRALGEAVAVKKEEFQRKHIALSLNVPARPCRIQGDAERIRQLLCNLLENSLRYTDEGGSLQVRLDEDERCVRLLFRDSAPGVPPEALPRLFERLFRAESSRNRRSGGAGLGPAICRNIAEAHGGTIEAAASPLGGIDILIQLPKESPS